MSQVKLMSVEDIKQEPFEKTTTVTEIIEREHMLPSRAYVKLTQIVTKEPSKGIDRDADDLLKLLSDLRYKCMSGEETLYVYGLDRANDVVESMGDDIDATPTTTKDDLRVYEFHFDKSGDAINIYGIVGFTSVEQKESFVDGVKNGEIHIAPLLQVNNSEKGRNIRRLIGFNIEDTRMGNFRAAGGVYDITDLIYRITTDLPDEPIHTKLYITSDQQYEKRDGSDYSKCKALPANIVKEGEDKLQAYLSMSKGQEVVLFPRGMENYSFEYLNDGNAKFLIGKLLQ